MLPTSTNLRRVIQFGLLLLLALMPFHAFLSVWLGHLTGHEAIIEAWKEVLLLILTVLSVALLWQDKKLLSRLRQPWILASAAFAALALIVTIATHPSLTATAFGLKTDLEFLLAAVIASLVATPGWIKRAIIVTLSASAVVIAFGLMQMFVLPMNFLVHFGYGPTTVAPYEVIAATNTPRFASTLGGPNQLGTYLILPLALSLVLALRRRQWWWLALTATGLIVLIGTYSRGAWIGAAAALALTLLATVPTHLRKSVSIGLACMLVLAALGLSTLIVRSPRLQTYLLHQSLASTSSQTSDAQHASSLVHGLEAIAAHPLGHGLGTAGPATFRSGSIFIIEDYYLQMAYETGLLGALLFVMITVLLIAKLAGPKDDFLALAAAAALLGVSFVALVLPSWTDSTTALVTWTIAGGAAGATGIGKRKSV